MPMEVRDCLAGYGRTGGGEPCEEAKDGVRRCGSNAEDVGLAYDKVPWREDTGFVGTMKSSANN